MNWYAYGYRSADAAQDALWGEIAAGRVSEADCTVCHYRNSAGKSRWGIKERAQ